LKDRQGQYGDNADIQGLFRIDRHCGKIGNHERNNQIKHRQFADLPFSHQSHNHKQEKIDKYRA
jgi:hypothetical protein